MADFGYALLIGIGIEKNDAEAAVWARKAAIAGDVQGMQLLSRMLSNGWGVAKEPGEAESWLRKAAETNDPGAMRALGNFLRTAEGNSAADREALVWIRRAAKANYQPAMLQLGLMLDSGKGAAKNQAEANIWFRKAADSGDTSAMVHLADNLNSGSGVEKDLVQGMALLRKAASASDPDAVQRLTKLGESHDYQKRTCTGIRNLAEGMIHNERANVSDGFVEALRRYYNQNNCEGVAVVPATISDIKVFKEISVFATQILDTLQLELAITIVPDSRTPLPNDKSYCRWLGGPANTDWMLSYIQLKGDVAKDYRYLANKAPENNVMAFCQTREALQFEFVKRSRARFDQCQSAGQPKNCDPGKLKALLGMAADADLRKVSVFCLCRDTLRK